MPSGPGRERPSSPPGWRQSAAIPRAKRTACRTRIIRVSRRPKPGPASGQSAGRRRGHRDLTCPISTSPWGRPRRTSPSWRRSRGRTWTPGRHCRTSARWPPRTRGSSTPRSRRCHCPDGGLVSADDCPRRGTNVHTLAELKPVFRPDGRVTAGNSCPLNDGAAAAVVMSDVLATHLGIRPMARIVSSAVSALDPEIMGLGPVEASRRALSRAGMTMGDVDLVEINEAFAAQVLPSARALRHPGGPAKHPRRRDRAGASVRDDRRSHPHHAAECPRPDRRNDRPGDDVRRRRAGHGHGARAARVKVLSAEPAALGPPPSAILMLRSVKPSRGAVIVR